MGGMLDRGFLDACAGWRWVKKHGQNVNANLMADNLYACQVTFGQLLNAKAAGELGTVWSSSGTKTGCGWWVDSLVGARKKFRRCQVAVKLLPASGQVGILLAQIESNGMKMRNRIEFLVCPCCRGS